MYSSIKEAGLTIIGMTLKLAGGYNNYDSI
jgi:hypothetical protein